jgi:hypothetical protein
LGHHGTKKQISATEIAIAKRKIAIIQFGFAHNNPLPNKADNPPAPHEIIALVFRSHGRLDRIWFDVHFINGSRFLKV